MTEPDFHEVLRSLAVLRPVFHSEADFQHALAWELHARFPGARVRLERPFASGADALHVDIAAEIGSEMFIFELKYKTEGIVVGSNSEVFVLQKHGAQPPGRYDIWKDVTRLESLASGHSLIHGFVCFLTNDSAYWSKPRSSSDTSAAFSVHEGRLVSGRLDWAANASPNTKRKREEPLQLRGEYRLHWRDYSTIQAASYARFRYLAIEVG